MVAAYFDCFSGIAGDMVLGALFDLGLDLDFFKKELKKLGVSGYEIDVKKIEKNHISACDVYIKTLEEQPFRSFKDIKNLIKKSSLSKDVQGKSIKIFEKIAEAEGKIHNIDVERVHFHEIGAVDSIIDVVGVVIGIRKLGIEKVYSSPLPLGKGFVKCSHGVIPVPAPATVEILRNIPVYQTERKQELVTPTGAAVITSFAEEFGVMPSMRINKIGYGAGKTKSEDYPSLLRVFLGELF